MMHNVASVVNEYINLYMSLIMCVTQHLHVYEHSVVHIKDVEIITRMRDNIL